MSPDILCERDTEIATVTLFNPDKRNAIDGAMWRRLRSVFDDLDAANDLRAIVIRGSGANFAAGGDIEEFERERDTRERARRYHGEWVAPALAAIADCRHPVVAAIEGACVGGGLEIASACDLRIAARDARFGAPIMKLGFPMYPGEMAGLLALAGPATTLEILLEGRLLDADEALVKGLVTRLVGAGETALASREAAQRIAAGAPGVARTHKRLVRRLQTAANTLDAAELDAFFDFLDSADYREGLAAFREKRVPRFTGA
jgi:enoyl-CoA hydratase/carnithine racemase